MRHQRTGKKLGRDSSHRRALYANLTAELIEHERIKTTVTKAKAVKPIAEQMITLGRRGDMHARRQAVAFLGSKDIVHKLFDELGPRYAERPGGYSRIVRLGPRPATAPRWCTSSSSTRRSSSSRGRRRRAPEAEATAGAGRAGGRWVTRRRTEGRRGRGAGGRGAPSRGREAARPRPRAGRGRARRGGRPGGLSPRRGRSPPPRGRGRRRPARAS